MEHHLSAIISKGEKYFVARGVEIELASQGTTIEEALENLTEAFELWLKHAEPDELEMLRHNAPLIAHVNVAA